MDIFNFPIKMNSYGVGSKKLNECTFHILKNLVVFMFIPYNVASKYFVLCYTSVFCTQNTVYEIKHHSDFCAFTTIGQWGIFIFTL